MLTIDAVIFAKTLRRKDVLGTSMPDEGSDSGEGQAKPAAGQNVGHKAKPSADSDSKSDDSDNVENENFARKAQVLNLFSVDCDRVAE